MIWDINLNHNENKQYRTVTINNIDKIDRFINEMRYDFGTKGYTKIFSWVGEITFYPLLVDRQKHNFDTIIEKRLLSQMDFNSTNNSLYHCGNITSYNGIELKQIIHQSFNDEFLNIIYVMTTKDGKRFIEIRDDFKVSYQLYPKELTFDHRIYCHYDSNIEQEYEVIRIDNINKHVEIKTNFLKKYLTLLQKDLVIGFKYGGLDVNTTEINKQQVNQIFSDRDQGIIYKKEKAPLTFNKNTNTMQLFVVGNKIIQCESIDKCGIFPYEEETKYEVFIVDSDSNGNVECSCDPSELNNEMNLHPDCKYSIFTLVFFKKEVLKYYSDQPEKYEITDRGIKSIDGKYCNRYLSVDNNTGGDYVVVCLEELGKHLTYKEQHRWRNFNINPDQLKSPCKTNIQKERDLYLAVRNQSNCNIKNLEFVSDNFILIDLMGDIESDRYKIPLYQLLDNLDNVNKYWNKTFQFALFVGNKFVDKSRISGVLINNEHSFFEQLDLLQDVLIESLNGVAIAKYLGKNIDKNQQSKGIKLLREFCDSNKIDNLLTEIMFTLQIVRSNKEHKDVGRPDVGNEEKIEIEKSLANFRSICEVNVKDTWWKQFNDICCKLNSVLFSLTLS